MFDDPFEGSYTRINVEVRAYAPEGIPDDRKKEYIEVMKKSGDNNKHWPRYTAISCWHMNESESAAMWSLYLKSDEGIAVQSTFKKLKKSLIDDEDIYLRVVRYIDYEKDYIDARNLFAPFVHKRKSFEHERELRGLILKWPTGSGKKYFEEETIMGGTPIKVDLEELIEKIYIAPNAPLWFANFVKTVVKK
jgi:hypothetical protein